MTPAPPFRQVVHLGFDSSGGDALGRLFGQADLPVLSWERGRLARQIAWRAAAGLPAAPEWSDAALLTELHSHSGAVGPPVEAFRLLQWLDREMQGALFLMTTRKVESWIVERLGATDLRRSAVFSAMHRGVTTADLPDLWAQDWAGHLAAVRTHFAGRSDYLELDLEDMDMAALADALAPHVAGLVPPRYPRRRVFPAPEPQAGVRAYRHMDDHRPTARMPQPGARMRPETLDRLVAFCLKGAVLEDGVPDRPANRSQIYTWFDGTARALDKKGAPAPVARLGVPGAGPVFVADPESTKPERIEGLLAQLSRLGSGRAVHIDMQDARTAGGPGRPAAGQPVLVYNRVPGAVNAVLWPLPGFHDIGASVFASAQNPDSQPFAEKGDVLVWRGNLSGVARNPDGTQGLAAQRLLTAAITAANPARRAEAEAALQTIPRYRTLVRHIGQPGMDLGLVTSEALRPFAGHPLLAPLIRPRLRPAEMLSCRYQLCLGGFDVGSNFVWAANSNCVLLAEEVEWEVYYTTLFRPWEHYIPLRPGCDDLPERLDWARANPAACVQMSAAARSVVAELADAAAQDEMMRRIAAALPVADPPTMPSQHLL